MRVLVTGAAGYVGQAVVAGLREAGAEPIALHRRSQPTTAGDVEVRTADLLAADELPAVLAGVDAVCHLAGRTRARESWAEPARFFQANAGGTANLLAAMAVAGVCRLVFASTGSIYGTPQQQPMDETLPDAPPHPYAASKLAAESAIEWQARCGRLGVVILRLFNVAGGDDPDPTRIVPQVLAAAAGELSAVSVNGDGTAVRDFLHIEDAAAAFVAAMEHCPPAGQHCRYNIGSGAGASVADVIHAAERVTGRTVPVVHRPPAAEPPTLVCDPARARAELGWKPAMSDLDTIVRHAWSARGRTAVE